jgi:hypothetical protein
VTGRLRITLLDGFGEREQNRFCFVHYLAAGLRDAAVRGTQISAPFRASLQ